MRGRALFIFLLLSLVWAAGAQAARVVTWETESRFVDPASVEFNSPPPGEPAREPGLRVNVYLPDNFTRERRYPVLYLLHNLDSTFEGWVSPSQGDLLKTAKGFPGIVVMPEGARGWYANWWNGGVRGNPGWERYHLEELIRLVHRRLPVRRARRWHAIAGPSMGGQGAAFYASARPGYFGAAGLFSAPLNIQRPEWPDVGMETQGENPLAVFGDPSAQRFYWAGHNPIELLPNLSHSRLFVIVGDGTPGPGEVGNIEDQLGERYLLTHSEEFVPAARAAGVDVTYERRLGIHDWPDWREHLAAAIRWGFFRKVPARARTWTYKTVARRSWVWGIRILFQDGPPTAVATFRRRGNRISATGVGRVRVRVRGGGSFTARLPFNRRLPARR